MNRATRRKIAKRMNKSQKTNLKSVFFKAILGSYGEGESESKKILEDKTIGDELIKGLFFPGTLQQMAVCIPAVNIDLSFDESLNMALMYCEKYIDELTKYVRLKDRYESLLLKDMLEDAVLCLDDIEKICGKSIWVYSQRLMIKERIYGLEGNKDLLSDYIKITRKNTIISTLLEFASYRAEENTSLINYNEKVDKFINRIMGSNAYDYFKYKLSVDDVSFSDNLSVVFQIDSQSSLIDLYNSIVDILHRATVNKKVLERESIIRLHNLNKEIGDYRIKNYFIVTGYKHEIEVEDRIIDIVERYTCEEYETVINDLENELNIYPNNIQLWMMLIKSYIYLGRQYNTSNRMIQNMYNIYSLADNCNVEKTKLAGDLKRYSDLSWKYALLSIQKRKLCISTDVSKYIRMSLFNERMITPGFINWLENDEQKQNAFDLIKHRAPKTVELFNSKSLSIYKNGSVRERIFLADRLIKEECYDEAIVVLESLEKETKHVLYIEEKIVRRLFNLYVITNQYKDAIDLIIGKYFINENLVKRCDLKCISERTKFIRNTSILKTINYPIFVFMADRLDIKNHRIAFSNFLDANGITTKEQLISLISESNDRLVFFYENVCNLNVIKRDARLVSNASAAFIIRGDILLRLIEINPNKKECYVQELSAITSKREINDRIRQVSQHKIYADDIKIKYEKQEIFEENFNKYLAIKSFNKELEAFDISDYYTIDSIKTVIDSMNEEIKRSTQYSQTILALKDLISGITYEFLRNEKYGLDTFLSSRIRHGYCKSQLTKELRELHLMLTSKDDESLEFDISQYWDDKISDDQIGDYQILKGMLSEFSREIEIKILEIRREWIRIRFEKNEVGCFDFSDVPSVLLVLDKNDITDFDDMYNTIILQLWDHTNTCLEKIRNKINGELKDFFYEQINRLENNIRSLRNTTISSIIDEIENNITKYKAKISNIISDFASIFYKDDIVYDDFTVNDLLVTCIGIERQIHAEFDQIMLEANAKGEKKIKGDSFSYFVEIIIMLMNNAISHAGFVDMKDIILNLDICFGNEYHDIEKLIDLVSQHENSKNKWTKENVLIITAKNNLIEGKNIAEIQKKMERIFDNVNDSRTLNKYSIKEGGSGIYKIYQTIKYNITAPYVILYDVQETKFELTLIVDTKILEVQGG